MQLWGARLVLGFVFVSAFAVAEEAPAGSPPAAEPKSAPTAAEPPKAPTAKAAPAAVPKIDCEMTVGGKCKGTFGEIEVKQGPTPRLNQVEAEIRRMRALGITDPDFVKKLGDLEKLADDISRGQENDKEMEGKLADLEAKLADAQDYERRIKQLEEKVDRLTVQRQPFALGLDFLPPGLNALYAGGLIKGEWTLPAMTSLFDIVLAPSVGLMHVSHVDDWRWRGGIGALASRPIGPGKAFGGVEFSVTSKLPETTSIDTAPVIGYGVEVVPGLTAAATVRYGLFKPYWQPGGLWGPGATIGFTYRPVGRDEQLATTPIEESGSASDAVAPKSKSPEKTPVKGKGSRKFVRQEK